MSLRQTEGWGETVARGGAIKARILAGTHQSGRRLVTQVGPEEARLAALVDGLLSERLSVR